MRIFCGKPWLELAPTKSARSRKSTPNPADAGCNSELAQYSNTPSLRVAGFEDEDDDENENENDAPGEGSDYFQEIQSR
jgi:hypothetical protein